MTKTISIFWFRQDLRLQDNEALQEALKVSDVLPIYILDDRYAIGQASKSYLHQSLISLHASLDGMLQVYKGDAETILLKLIKKYEVADIFLNSCCEPWAVDFDAAIVKKLSAFSVKYHVYNGSYLIDPYALVKADGSYYKVFGAFKKRVLALTLRKPFLKPKTFSLVCDSDNKMSIDDLGLLHKNPWNEKIQNRWTAGEVEAHKQLQHFIKKGLLGYKVGRDFPALGQTSLLSASLHYGEVSPFQVRQAIIDAEIVARDDKNHFLSELLWREFAAYLLTHFKTLPSENFKKKFNTFSWQTNQKLFDAWKMGKTGYPLVDAGMRELYTTGYMHNRVRMVVASFLVKNLMIDWREGQEWFLQCLVDADLANNSFNWQWVAGTGVDAAPYFRIFNPTTQGQKFDKEGLYTKKFVPELALLPHQYLFEPWKAPEKILQSSKIVIGKDYPEPIIDIKASREKTLSLYKSLKY